MPWCPQGDGDEGGAYLGLRGVQSPHLMKEQSADVEPVTRNLRIGIVVALHVNVTFGSCSRGIELFGTGVELAAGILILTF